MTVWLQIGGTLTFFHEEVARRCLEVTSLLLVVKELNQNWQIIYCDWCIGIEFIIIIIILQISITLEISETINRRFVHPSRRNSPTITKVFVAFRLLTLIGVRFKSVLMVLPKFSLAFFYLFQSDYVPIYYFFSLECIYWYKPYVTQPCWQYYHLFNKCCSNFLPHTFVHDNIVSCISSHPQHYSYPLPLFILLLLTLHSQH